MAGRPRTMLKRVEKLHDQLQQLTAEVRQLGKQHLPAPGEIRVREYPKREADLLPYYWQEVAIGCNLLESEFGFLLCALEDKAEKAGGTGMRTRTKHDS